MRRLATVILHYGSAVMTEKLFRQLSGQDVFVFDNNAPEPFAGAWKRARTNLYWPGALELCAGEMKKHGFSHLWFLNNDIVFSDPAGLFERVRTRHTWITRQLGKIGLYSPSVTRSPYHAQMTCQPVAQFARASYIDGIAPLIDLTCLGEIGGLDIAENIYGYGVDVWLSWRAAQAGWNVIVDHQVVIHHKYHSTAATVNGYLQKAAGAEQVYLAARLGPDFRRQLAEMAQNAQLF